MTDVPLPILHPELEALARRALKHLESLGYSESSLSYFELTWRRLCVFAQAQELPDGLSEDLLDQFLAHHHVPAAALSANEGETATTPKFSEQGEAKRPYMSFMICRRSIRASCRRAGQPEGRAAARGEATGRSKTACVCGVCG